jgi:hypothetical protein
MHAPRRRPTQPERVVETSPIVLALVAGDPHRARLVARGVRFAQVHVDPSRHVRDAFVAALAEQVNLGTPTPDSMRAALASLLRVWSATATRTDRAELRDQRIEDVARFGRGTSDAPNDFDVGVALSIAWRMCMLAAARTGRPLPHDVDPPAWLKLLVDDELQDG